MDIRLNLECALLTNKTSCKAEFTWRSKVNRKNARSLISLALVKPHLAKLRPVLGCPDHEGCGETGKRPKDGYTDGQYLEFQQGDVKGTVKRRLNRDLTAFCRI